MGLGLSLCHRIIESFHGEIEVRSIQGHGDSHGILASFTKKSIRSM